MVSKKVTVLNKSGLHARPASQFVEAANEFKSDIYLHKENATVSAKSIMGVMVLGISKGSEIVIQAEGPDEREAVDTLIKLIETKFGED